MKKEKGFTLIELLAVIVILAILMVIAVPKILNVIENSRKSAAESSIKLVKDAIKTQVTSGSIMGTNFTSDDDGCYTFNFDDQASGNLKSGDAFDCDVNGDGKYNSDTERFYYVTDMNDSTAVLIYYNNVSKGKPSNNKLAAYDASGENFHGPRTAIEELPSTSEWKNVSLTSNVRSIIAQDGTNSTTGGPLPVSFSYSGKAARLLTTQEINQACDITSGTQIVGELDKCNYLMENTMYSNASNLVGAWWLENPNSGNSDTAWLIHCFFRNVGHYTVSAAGDDGVRPAIEVPKSNIEY